MSHHHSPLALIAPVDRVVGWVTEDGSDVALLSPGEGNGSVVSVGAFLSRYPDAQLVAGRTENDVLEQLEVAEENSFALEFALLLFDQQVGTNTRCEISAELNALLESQEIWDYLLDILLSAPLPKSADTAGARKACLTHQRTSALVSSIVDNADRVTLTWSTWRGMRMNLMAQSQDYQTLTGHLINCSVFRKVVLEARDKTQLDMIRQQLISDRHLNARCDSQILSTFLSAVRRDLPLGKSQTKLRSQKHRDDPEGTNNAPQPARRNAEPRNWGCAEIRCPNSL